MPFAGQAARTRPALRAALPIRNERLGDILARLVGAGQLARSGDLWVAPGLPFPFRFPPLL